MFSTCVCRTNKDGTEWTDQGWQVTHLGDLTALLQLA